MNWLAGMAEKAYCMRTSTYQQGREMKSSKKKNEGTRVSGQRKEAMLRKIEIRSGPASN